MQISASFFIQRNSPSPKRANEYPLSRINSTVSSSLLKEIGKELLAFEALKDTSGILSKETMSINTVFIKSSMGFAS